MMKKQKVQEELDSEENKKEEGFDNDLKQAQYKKSPI